MKALTIWQPWASLIMAGAKPYEFRRWPAPRALWGRRIVIHAGARPVRDSECRDLIDRIEFGGGAGTALDPVRAMKLLRDVVTGRSTLPLGSALGAATLGTPRPAVEIFAQANDSDRIDHHVWAWPLTDIQPFEPFFPVRGAQGFWDLPEGVT